MSLDTHHEAAAPKIKKLRLTARRAALKPAEADTSTAPSYKRMPATELLKALLGIRARQRAEYSERVKIRLSVATPSGRNAVSLWLHGRDSLA